MSNLYEEVRQQFETVRDEIKKALADGKLQLREITGIVRSFVEAGVLITNKLIVPNEEKRELIVEAMMDWWNDPKDGLKKMDLPGPDALFDPVIEALLPLLTGLLVDTIVTFYNRVGWPSS